MNQAVSINNNSIKKKYFVYTILNRLGMGMEGYEKLLNSEFYNSLRRNHKRETE